MRVDADAQQVYVKGLNLRHRHIRRSQKNPKGGRVQKEAPIHISNVQLVDPKTNKPTRVGTRRDGDTVVRYAKRSGQEIP